MPPLLAARHGYVVICVNAAVVDRIGDRANGFVRIPRVYMLNVDRVVVQRVAPRPENGIDRLANHQVGGRQRHGFVGFTAPILFVSTPALAACFRCVHRS